jgi:hypothetical protein
MEVRGVAREGSRAGVGPSVGPRIDWEDVQRTRIAACQALEEYEEQASQDPKRLKQLLKDVLIVMFHSVQPPDRYNAARRTEVAHSCHS